jgi:hypothetical protein
MARRQQWTIIGSPAISASGLRGSLVAPIRDGMTIKGLAIGPSFPFYSARLNHGRRATLARLRQFALVRGFFCAITCRICKEEILGLW